MWLSQERRGIIRPVPDDQVLIMHAATHVAVDQEAQSTEHLFFGDRSAMNQQSPNTCGELLVVGHKLIYDRRISDVIFPLYSIAEYYRFKVWLGTSHSEICCSEVQSHMDAYPLRTVWCKAFF